MNILYWLCVLTCCVSASNDELYKGYNLVQITTSNDVQVQSLRNLKERWDDRDGVQFWDDRRTGTLVHVSPQSVPSFMDELHKRGLHSEIISENLQSMIQEEMRNVKRSKRSISNNIGRKEEFDFETYHTLEEIYDYINDLASKFKDVNVTTVLQTYEDRDIKLVTVGNGKRPAVYLECGIHAREWISPAVCLHILNDLTTNQNDDILQLRRNYDFYMFPVTNPDGYEFTWTKNRLWRKNRKPILGGLCTGVDLNRNFDARFGGPGSSPIACTDIYHGPYAFSEFETQAEKMVLQDLKDINSVWSVHSYSELLMYPYCYRYKKSKDEKEMFSLTQKIAEKIESVNGISYDYGSCANTVYICSGTMTDWVYDELGLQYSYDVELRDSREGKHGFMLPKEQINPTFKEFWSGVKLGIDEISARKQLQKHTH